jgi:RecB family exonuclease
MNTTMLSFRDNPARICAKLIRESEFLPGRTLVISPTQRFKSALAASLMDVWGSDSVRAPEILSSEELLQEVAACLGIETANQAQAYSMLYHACTATKDVHEIFPERFLENFLFFKSVAERTLQAFDELNTEEIDLHQFRLGEMPYAHFQRHFEIFRKLYEKYCAVQKDAGVYGQSYLLRQLRAEDIEKYFERYTAVLLLLPVSLTAFEKRLYSHVREKLWVLLQDTNDYDFAPILAFRNGRAHGPDRYPAVRFFEPPSRIHQLMLTLSIIHEECEKGTPLHEIAILNMDPLSCRMLYDSLLGAGFPVNYSEGLPVRTSPLYGLLRLACRFFESHFDTRYFLELLAHPLFLEAFKLKGSDLYPKVKQRVCRERIFRLPGIGSSLLGEEPKVYEGCGLLHGMYSADSFKALGSGLSSLVFRITEKKSYDFYAVRDLLLNTAAELEDLSIGVKDRPFEIFLQLVKTRSYPLTGVYSRGIQILGLLETRGIPFKTVIAPSFNEGHFPYRGSENVLFNLQVKKELGLPTLLDREMLQFYYLKRLIDSSDRTVLLSLQDKRGEVDVKCRYCYYFSSEPYVEGSGKSGSSGPLSQEQEQPSHEHTLCRQPSSVQGSSAQAPSGYLNQDIPYTLPLKASYGLPVLQRDVTQPSARFPGSGFSRLDLDRIKRCETQFFISKVLGIREEQSLSREVELRVVGMKAHDILRELYSLSLKDEQSALDRLDVVFEKHLRDGTFYTAEEQLTKRLLKASLSKVVRGDFERFRAGYRLCDEFMERELKAQLEGEEVMYSLTGRIDRIDVTPSGTYEIIDYKTGRLPSRKDHFSETRFSEIQLGFYGLLFIKNFPESRIEALSYYDLTGKRDIERVVEHDRVNGYLAEFSVHLRDLLNAFRKKQQLDLTDDMGNCTYCPYFNICRVFEE